MAQVYLSFLIVIAVFAFTITAIHLPYEVLDTIVELSDIEDYKDLNRVNVSDDRGPTRPIYRLDLDPEYIAYYEIDTGSEYIVLSSGRKTGDSREVESGPDPRPTDMLIQQAQENGQQCEKFYRLSPLGLTVCKNDNGTVVAASYNWTAGIPQIKDWRLLDGMVKDSFDSFKRLWLERAAERQSKLDWATTDIISKFGNVLKTETDEEELSPGSVVKVALGERVRSVNVYIEKNGNSPMRPSTRSEWQLKLCKVLVDVCLLDGSTKVNPSVMKETPNHLLFLQLEVHGDRNFVGNTLQWREIGFAIEIKGSNNEVVKKYYAINLHLKRLRRSSCSMCIPTPSTTGGTTKTKKVTIKREKDDFPDYKQHECCGPDKKCFSGCAPVSWAQVFGYYDRLGSPFSSNIYGDKNKRAPRLWTGDEDIKTFVMDIRRQLGTTCSKDNEGSTDIRDMWKLKSWFQNRQGSRAQLITYLKSRKRRGSGGVPSYRGSSSWLVSETVYWINKDYTVVLAIKVLVDKEKGGHSVVATGYKETSHRYRHCRMFPPFPRLICSWKTDKYYQFFLRYGWGEHNNKCHQISPLGAYVAYLSPY